MSDEPGPDSGQPADFQTAFWSAKHALAHASAAAFAQHGVHEGQQYVLRCLWREDGLSPGEIARRLGVTDRERSLHPSVLERRARPADNGGHQRWLIGC